MLERVTTDIEMAVWPLRHDMTVFTATDMNGRSWSNNFTVEIGSWVYIAYPGNHRQAPVVEWE